jgi:hypothetical protein
MPSSRRCRHAERWWHAAVSRIACGGARVPSASSLSRTGSTSTQPPSAATACEPEIPLADGAVPDPPVPDAVGDLFDLVAELARLVIAGYERPVGLFSTAAGRRAFQLQPVFVPQSLQV